ncbi:MAG: hypothetical protein JSW10_11680 [Pseudomonadota bacterium]|nr:MAG: hypothetical protein JSW10_11680 [Pseudomonadota bacterium]
MVWFTVSVVVLAVLLFFPVSKLVWVMSVRRLQRKLQRELSDAEVEGQQARARFIAVFVSLAFSFVFNVNLLGWPAHG